MRRALKIGLIALPWLLLVGLFWNDLRSIDLFAIDASTDAQVAARQGFFADLAFEGCVPREAVIAAAEARGWVWQDMEALQWCHRPAGLSDWLRVEVSPPLPFSTDDENAAFVGFDVQDCMTAWDYATGPGTTCPDG